ncbi:MAG: PilT protein [Rhizobium sp.]|nr:PilT protein [Rhizobium sp.]
MIVLDTHVLVWTVENNARLGITTRTLIDAETQNGRILVSAISLWEVAMLVEKDRLALGQDVRNWVENVLDLSGVELAHLLPSISLDCVRLPGRFHADPADRMITATARYHQATLVTADRQILDYAAQGHVIAQDAQK